MPEADISQQATTLKMGQKVTILGQGRILTVTQGSLEVGGRIYESNLRNTATLPQGNVELFAFMGDVSYSLSS